MLPKVGDKVFLKGYSYNPLTIEEDCNVFFFSISEREKVSNMYSTIEELMDDHKGYNEIRFVSEGKEYIYHTIFGPMRVIKD
jgi:hypothetical protein